MKKLIKLILLAIIFICSCQPNNLHNGDIIFQVSQSSQSRGIQKATNSKYSHMGIIYILKGDVYVYEAVGPVKITPFKKWIARGEDKHYVVKRLIDWKNVLTEENLLKMKESGDQFLGKPYDFYFNWSDENIYCSELVWKMYHRALNIDIGELKTLEDFDLSSPEVQKLMKKRYPQGVPLDMSVISPADMYNSSLLITVKEY